MRKNYSDFTTWYYSCYFNGMRIRYTKGWDYTTWEELKSKELI